MEYVERKVLIDLNLSKLNPHKINVIVSKKILRGTFMGQI